MSLDSGSSRMHRRDKKVLLKDFNSILTCTLCNGYFIDATTFDCMHTFCRSCILNHFETTKQQTCPTCHKKKDSFKPDLMLQSLVYKMVPGLFGKESQRREDFYRSSVRASSTCSEDSLLGDLRHDHKWDQADQVYFSPEDPISLSLEFYQLHLDDTDIKDNNRRLSAIVKRQRSASFSSSLKQQTIDADDAESAEKKCEGKMKGDRRYLQCPAAVSMSHLQKFLRMKYALSAEHRVDIIYEGEVLPLSYTLMDVAYTFSWNKLKPMRFFYRIFTPLKVQPIKIINTPTSNGGKHLQIVPVRPNSELAAAVAAAEAEKSKEQFVAQLKLQSKHKSTTLPTSTSLPHLRDDENCIFEYEEPDKEEIKRFAESRDREWAQMRSEDIGTSSHHVKKRKKSKHSKGDVKKPKIHAEITSSDVTPQESIKLKVKLTPAHAHNGHGHSHKHKHRNQVETTPTPNVVQSHPMSTQTEPKKVSPIKKLNDIIVKKADPKLKTALETSHKVKDGKESKTSLHQTSPKSKLVKQEEDQQKTFLKTFPVDANQRHPISKVPSPSNSEQKKPLNTYSNQTKKISVSPQTQPTKVVSHLQAYLESAKASPNQKVSQPAAQNQKVSQPTAQNHKVSQSTVQNQKISQTTTAQNQKVVQQKVSQTQTSQNLKVPQPAQSPKVALSQKVPNQKVPQTGQNNNKVMKPTTNHRSSPNQVPPKVLNSGTPSPKQEPKRVTFAMEKPHILNSQQYPSGFTVSKIEQGQKRKSESDQIFQTSGEKRPCLEITLIDTPPEAPKLKRPPPATIPLDRIKKSISKPKSPEVAGTGALDLSKKLEPSKPNGLSGLSGVTTLNGIGIKTINGMKFPNTTVTPVVEKNALSNLQMLSKVALQHSKQTTSPVVTTPTVSTSIAQKARPQIPNLQTLRSPNLNPAISNNNNNNHKNLPKLTEINKANLKMIQNGGLKMTAGLSRGGIAHHHQNHQNNMMRSIPNPAMMVRQHSQSRMGLNSTQNNNNQTESGGKKESQSNKNLTQQNQQQQSQQQQQQQQQQPKILNPLAKENTELGKDLNGNGTGTGNNGSGNLLNSLLNKLLDKPLNSSTVGTATS